MKNKLKCISILNITDEEPYGNRVKTLVLCYLKFPSQRFLSKGHNYEVLSVTFKRNTNGPCKVN